MNKNAECFEDERKISENEFTMESFVCGNYDEIYIKQIVGNKSIKKMDKELKYNFYEHDTFKWKFYLSPNDVSNGNANIDNVKKTLRTLFIKKRTNTVIIYFADKIGDELKSIVQQFMTGAAKGFQPCFLFLTKESEPDFEFFNTCDYPQRIEIETLNIQDPTSIIIKLVNFCSYLNQLGDDATIPGFQSFLEKNKEKINHSDFPATFNMLFCGKPGVGKSSLINYIMNEKKCREGTGQAVTHFIQKFNHKEFPISAFDCPGFENKEDVQKVLRKIIRFNEELHYSKDCIHLLLYIMDSNSKRNLISEEIKMIKELLGRKIKILFIVNMCKSRELGNEFKEILEMTLESEQIEYSNKVFCLNLRSGVERNENNEIFGITEIYNEIFNIFKKDMIDLTQLDKLKNKDEKEIIKIIQKSEFFSQITCFNDIKEVYKKKAWEIIGGFCVAGAAAGAIPFPIPGLTTPILFTLEGALVVRLIFLYRSNLTKEDVLKSVGGYVAIGGAGFTLGQFAKFIPFFGSALCSSIAAGAILAIGKSCISLFESEIESIGMKKYIKTMADCYNKAVNYFNKNKK